MSCSITKILIFTFMLYFSARGQVKHEESIAVQFWGEKIVFTQPFKELGNIKKLNAVDQYSRLVNLLDNQRIKSLSDEMLQVKQKKDLNDWFYYQLIRRISQNIIAKQENYIGYTLLKQMLLQLSGFDARVFLSNNKILLYVKSSDTVYNIPVKMIHDNQYVCLNYHDYDNNIDFSKEQFETEISNNKANKSFSYRIRSIPPFPADSTISQNITFYYRGKQEEYSIKVNPNGKEFFKNYPVVDYRYQFSIPFSSNIEESLIAALKKRIMWMSQNEAISYLMEFTRSGFQYATDKEIYGGEKRMSPEETILSDKSDCEDRSSLMFALLRRLFDIPVIVISYPDHVNLGIALDKPLGRGIPFDGIRYTICEPTPQKKKYKLGYMDKNTFKKGYEIAFSFMTNISPK